MERANLKDYHDKYQREFQQREDLQMKYVKMNQLLESQAQDYHSKVAEITQEKEQLVHENKVLRD